MVGEDLYMNYFMLRDDKKYGRKRSPSPEITTTVSKIPRLATPGVSPSAFSTLPMPQHQQNESSTNTPAIQVDKVPVAMTINKTIPQKPSKPPLSDRQNALQDRLDNLLSGSVKPKSWKDIADAHEFKKELGIEAYRNFVQAVLQNSNESEPLTVWLIVREHKYKWHYDIGNGRKPSTWIDWADLKPYLKSCRIRFTINQDSWAGNECMDFLRLNIAGAPQLSRVEIHITYSQGSMGGCLYDAKGLPKWEYGIKWYVQHVIAPKVWEYAKVKKIACNNKERAYDGSKDWRWYCLARDQLHGWPTWEEEMMPPK